MISSVLLHNFQNVYLEIPIRENHDVLRIRLFARNFGNILKIYTCT